MPKNAWVEAVYKPGISPVKKPALCTLSTAAQSNFLHESFFVRTLNAVYARLNYNFTQVQVSDLHLVGGRLYSFSTMPNEATNKLIKGLVI